MKKERIPTIFSESTISDKPARQVARKPGPLRRRAVCRFAERRRRPGADWLDLLRVTTETIVNGIRTDEEAAMNAAQAGLYVDQLTVTGATATRPARRLVQRAARLHCRAGGVNGSVNPALMGFVRVGHGEIAILGQPVNRALRQNSVAYVPQSEEVDWSFPVLVEDGDDGPLRPYGLAAAGKPRDREIVDARWPAWA